MAEITDSQVFWIVDRLGAAKREADIMDAMTEATALLNFDHFTLVTALHTMGEYTWRQFLSTAPKGFLDWYEEKEMFLYDPVVARAVTTVESFYSPDQISMLKIAGISLTFLYQAGRYGCAFALTAMQHGDGGALTFCNFGRKVPHWPWNRERARRIASWIVANAHEAMLRVLQVGAEGQREGFAALNEKERKCLQLLGRGTTVKKTANELGVSVSSVGYYSDRAMQKLGANKTRDAIKMALETRQISLHEEPRPWSASDKYLIRPGGLQPSNADAPIEEEALIGLCHDMRAATSDEALLNALECACAALGFERYAAQVRVPAATTDMQVVYTNYDARMREMAEDEDSVVNNPVFGADGSRALPLFWDRPDTLESAVEREALRQTLVGDSSLDIPRHGVSTMSYSPDGGRSTLAFARRQPIPEVPVRDWLAPAVFTVGKTFHLAITATLDSVMLRIDLTPEQLRCLRCAGFDMTIAQTAEAVGKSEAAVKWLLRAAAEKLGVKTSAQALARATELGMFRSDVEITTIDKVERSIRR